MANDYKTDVENPNNLKSDEMISVEDAVWLVEAALNYTYCMTYEDMPEVDFTMIDSTFTSIDIVDKSINYSEVIEIYNEFSNWLNEIKTNFGDTDMYFSLADVENVENSIVVRVSIEYGHESSLKNTETYTIYGDWKWGLKLGNCSGQYVGQRDATTEITKYLRDILSNGSNSQPYVYYTDVVYQEFYCTTPQLGGLLYYDVSDSYNYCMPQFEVRNWAELSPAVHQIAKSISDQSFANWNRHIWISCNYKSIRIGISNFHGIDEKYGIPHYGAPIDIEM